MMRPPGAAGRGARRAAQHGPAVHLGCVLPWRWLWLIEQAPLARRSRMRGSFCTVLLCCASCARAEEAAGDADASANTLPTEQHGNPTNTAQQAQAALYIEASVRKEVDLALRTYLRCEACQAIAFQVLLEFSVAEQRSGSKRGQLAETHIAMALDEYGACTPANFEEHQLYELNGTRYLGGSVRQ